MTITSRVAQPGGGERANDGIGRNEGGDPGALTPVDEPLAGEADGANEPERDDAQAVGAVGRVLGEAEELEGGQRDGGSVASQGADEARYGDEDGLQPHGSDPLSP